jgi:hypothetical protein
LKNTSLKRRESSERWCLLAVFFGYVREKTKVFMKKKQNSGAAAAVAVIAAVAVAEEVGLCCFALLCVCC